MVQVKAFVAALALTASASAHVPDGSSFHAHIARRSLEGRVVKAQNEIRGLLGGLAGVLNGLTNGLDSVLDPNANLLTTVVNGVTVTVATLLAQIADIPKLQLPLNLGTTTGFIVLSGPEDGYLGLAPNSNNIVGSYGLVKAKTDAVRVTIPAISCLTLPNVFPIYAPLSGQAPGVPLISAVSFTNNDYDTLSPTTGGFGFIQGSNFTAAGTYAQGVSMYANFGAESTIWSMKCSTRELSAVWTDKNGKTFPLAVMEYYQPTGFLEFTGNIAEYNKRYKISGTGYNADGNVVKLVFVPEDESNIVDFSILKKK